ncbi:23293_t:CDS:2 [Gigaspora margarita]|uniref:23293_t:CDS:1 n=1 Tax=Gigaspora margarita TaxID=4874 RepID=A0ABM8W073_GIGMA|nr:23293_t:CDS:2 [Gigaspora margarita]
MQNSNSTENDDSKQNSKSVSDRCSNFGSLAFDKDKHGRAEKSEALIIVEESAIPEKYKEIISNQKDDGSIGLGAASQHEGFGETNIIKLREFLSKQIGDVNAEKKLTEFANNDVIEEKKCLVSVQDSTIPEKYIPHSKQVQASIITTAMIPTSTNDNDILNVKQAKDDSKDRISNLVEALEKYISLIIKELKYINDEISQEQVLQDKMQYFAELRKDFNNNLKWDPSPTCKWNERLIYKWNPSLTRKWNERYTVNGSDHGDETSFFEDTENYR